MSQIIRLINHFLLHYAHWCTYMDGKCTWLLEAIVAYLVFPKPSIIDSRGRIYVQWLSYIISLKRYQRHVKCNYNNGFVINTKIWWLISDRDLDQ